MSTYYTITCKDCGECCDAAQESMHGVGNLLDSHKLVPSFLVAHAYHDIKVTNDLGDEPYYTLEELEPEEWTIDNMTDMMTRRGKRK